MASKITLTIPANVTDKQSVKRFFTEVAEQLASQEEQIKAQAERIEELENKQ